MDKIVVPAAAEPITLEQAKAELDVIHNSDDAKIAAKIAEARDYCERFIGQKLMPQTWDMVMDCMPTPGVSLSFKPVQSVVSVSYVDSNNVVQSVGVDDYFADAINGWVSATLTNASGKPNSVQIRYVAGYQSVSLIPGSIIAAIKYKLRLLYDDRTPGEAKYIDEAIKHLLDPLRENMGV